MRPPPYDIAVEATDRHLRLLTETTARDLEITAQGLEEAFLNLTGDVEGEDQ